MDPGQATSGTDGGSEGPRRPRSVRLGRRIFVVTLVVYTLALCAAAARSWWPSIFWPTPSPDAAEAYRGVPCADGLAELRGLLDAELVRVVRLEPPKTRDLWADWDDRYVALEPACARPGADPADAYSALYRLRHRYATFARRFEAQAAPLGRETTDRTEQARDARSRQDLAGPLPRVASTPTPSPARAGEPDRQIP